MKSMIAQGCFAAVIVLTAACSPRRIPPVTVADLMEDRVALDGVLMKCNREPAKARQDTDCMNARI
ncbi:MAG TPA: EexN family lipoprotein, partial [Steroidobacteraceae bacterium]|nr:EexN family lipoprotein [Steroidobacteraceae bacterium]